MAGPLLSKEDIRAVCHLPGQLRGCNFDEIPINLSKGIPFITVSKRSTSASTAIDWPVSSQGLILPYPEFIAKAERERERSAPAGDCFRVTGLSSTRRLLCRLITTPANKSVPPLFFLALVLVSLLLSDQSVTPFETHTHTFLFLLLLTHCLKTE